MPEGRRFLAGGSLPGEQHLAVGLFLFGVKKEPKNRHRFEAVTPTRAAALDPGSAATLRRPTQALGGLSKEWIKMT